MSTLSRHAHRAIVIKNGTLTLNRYGMALTILPEDTKQLFKVDTRFSLSEVKLTFPPDDVPGQNRIIVSFGKLDVPGSILGI